MRNSHLNLPKFHLNRQKTYATKTRVTCMCHQISTIKDIPYVYYALFPQGNMTKGMEVTGHLLPVPMIRMKGTLPSTFTQTQLTLFSASSGHVKRKSPSFTSQSSFSRQDEATFSSVSASISLQVKLRSSCKSQHLHQSLYLMLVLTLSQWSS